MKIPVRVKVGARVYIINVVGEDASMLSDTIGEIDYRTQRIKLLNLASRQAMEQNLLHEIVHAIAYDMGYTEHDEREIDMLANELHRLIVDNPMLFAPEGQAEPEQR